MAPHSGRKLVIVESPAKAKKIAEFLGAGYDVDASVGHIRDLPNPSELPADMKKGPYGRFAVDVDNGFDAYNVVDSGKRKKVAELKRLLKNADELLLATDEDREGEAIAWHLLEVLKPTVPVRRMVFHEITKEAIVRAVNETRELDTRLVDAQETRRILDRLYGYEVSPVLWRKVRQGLSAGRVQSVATRIVVQRERERMAFCRASYWDVEGDFAPDPAAAQAFSARLSLVDGKRVATGRDFGDDGTLKGANVVQLDETAANLIANAVMDSSEFTVTDVAEKPYTRRPYAPFTTSTLQQEASRKLRLSSKNAMRVAQRLYENGYITYMRTDSTTLSEAALSAARSQARDMYGAEYVPDSPRRYEKKVKNAQEAHEAIRPAGDRFRTPAQVAGQLRGEEFALYELIWKRTVASQMADARGSTATVKLGATLAMPDGPRVVEFSASGTVITFRGFLAAYEEGRDDDATARAQAADEERRLPKLSVGVALDVLRADADGHETSPPARYTEATLVKAMEERGIGRPSTYATIMGTIQDRGYVNSRGSALIPTWLAFAVTRLLEEHFGNLVDYDFTASMEEGLDRIANGEEEMSTGSPASTSATRPSRSKACAISSRTLARSMPARSPPSRSVRGSSYGSAATALTSRRPSRPGWTLPLASLSRAQPARPVARRSTTTLRPTRCRRPRPVSCSTLQPTTVAFSARTLRPDATSWPRPDATARTSPRCCRKTSRRSRARPRSSRARPACSRTWT